MILRRSTATIQPRSSESEAQFLSLSEIENWKAETLAEQLFSQEMIRAEQIEEQLRAVARRSEGFDGRSAPRHVALQHDACTVGWSDSIGDAAIQARRCNDMAEAELMRVEEELEKLLMGSGASEFAAEHRERGRLPVYTLGSIAVMLSLLAFLSSTNAPVDPLLGHFASTVNHVTMSDDEVASLVAATLAGVV